MYPHSSDLKNWSLIIKCAGYHIWRILTQLQEVQFPDWLFNKILPWIESGDKKFTCVHFINITILIVIIYFIVRFHLWFKQIYWKSIQIQLDQVKKLLQNN